MWKAIQHSNPLLACLVDVATVSDTAITIIDQIKLESDNIIKQLGIPINLRLVQVKTKFYFHLFATDAQIWAEMDSAKDNVETVNVTTDIEEAADITTDPEDATLINELIDDSDDSVALKQNILQSIKWPNTIYSVIKAALENFSSTPRYSKEAFVIHSPSSIIESTLAIARGEVLCVKIYRQRAFGIALTSFYHFGVYVGKMTTKDGTELEHGVIELTKTKETGSISINAVPLEGYEKGTCFVMKKTKSGHLPLLFKVAYEKRTQKEKEETADRALDFYNNSEYYLKEYSLFSNNCEHFVNMCAFGKPYCEQHFRAILTTLPNFFKGSPAALRVLRYLLIVVAEVAEAASQSPHIMTYLGESVALIFLMIEYAFRIFWDIYLLKKSGRLTLRNVWQLMKRHTLSMAPEMLTGIGFLLVAVLCTVTGPIGMIIGISGTIIMILLRLIVRPRIERWVERCEAARLEDFLQWHPHEVARLAMDTSEEDDTHEEILANFKSKKLSGKAVSELINRERENPSENHLANTLEFLDPNRLKLFKQNLKGILGHFDISEQLKSSIKLMYNERSFSIEIPDMSTTTVRQLLNVARLNWQINFEKGHWQVSRVNPEDMSKSVIASYINRNSLAKKIDTLPDSPTIVELIYEEPSWCTLL
jgi:hypothetical protein